MALILDATGRIEQTRLVRRMLAVVVGTLALMSGCRGRDAEPIGPFKLGDLKVLKPGETPRAASDAAKVVVSLRGDGGSVKAGDKLLCEVTVTAPTRDVMPTNLTLELTQADKIFDGCRPKPYEDAGSGVYLLRGELTAPKQPGRYQIRAVAIDMQMRKATKDTDAEITSTTTKSPAIELEVLP